MGLNTCCRLCCVEYPGKYSEDTLKIVLTLEWCLVLTLDGVLCSSFLLISLNGYSKRSVGSPQTK